MATHKKFFIYFLLVVAFFIFSKIMIYIAVNTSYKYKDLDIKSELITSAEVQATSINGFAKTKVKNNTESILENKYIKVACYSKNETLMGTKYIKIDKLDANEEKEFEVHFNFNKVDKAMIDVVEEAALTDDVTEIEKKSDPKMTLAAIVAALVILHFI